MKKKRIEQIRRRSLENTKTLNSECPLLAAPATAAII